MLFYSSYFLLFFPLVVLGYYLVPRPLKNSWLLISSVYFYLSWNPEYFVLIAAVTVISWGAGMLLDIGRRRQWEQKNLRFLLVGSVTFCIGVLFSIKYYGFAFSTLIDIMRWFGISGTPPFLDVLLPVGLSFYSFQAVGYLVDIYRGELQAEKSFLRYSLFLIFFPKLVSGPIERGGEFLPQLQEAHPFRWEQVRDGLLLMGWGLFQKLVIADRIALLADEVFAHYGDYTGLQICFTLFLFSFQIYCDFAGYSDIAVGAAGMMGFRLTKNFDSPYLAVTVREFWRNWHKSLTSWLRDYLYIPLGGNRRGRWKKYRNQLVTFAVSGLWHGASWHYVLWGVLNGFYCVVGDITQDCRDGIRKKLKISEDGRGYRIFQRICTFLLIEFSWIFFRASDFKTAFGIIGHILLNFGGSSVPGNTGGLEIFALKLAKADLFALFLCLGVFVIIDAFRGKVSLKAVLMRQPAVVRACCYYLLIFSVLLFGVYGANYDASVFLYFQF